LFLILWFTRVPIRRETRCADITTFGILTTESKPGETHPKALETLRRRTRKKRISFGKKAPGRHDILLPLQDGILNLKVVMRKAMLAGKGPPVGRWASRWAFLQLPITDRLGAGRVITFTQEY
jgi:hypothetical protein